MSVAFRQPTFKNPIPNILKSVGSVFTGILIGLIAFGESAGRARAAAELSRHGYHEEAKYLMLDMKKD